MNKENVKSKKRLFESTEMIQLDKEQLHKINGGGWEYEKYVENGEVKYRLVFR